MDILPNFFITTPPKTGSYSLWYYLSMHPEILMSKKKEPGYFMENSKLTLDQYKSFFSHYRGEKAIGEATPYLGERGVAFRIKKLIPKAKLIFCFRNPIERAVSHYQYRLGRGDEKRSFNDLIESNNVEFPLHYSMYFSHVKEYLSLFPRDQCLFFIVERMVKNFQSSLKDICNFLQVDTNFKFKLEGFKNITIPTKGILPKLLKGYNKNDNYNYGNYNRPNILLKSNFSLLEKILLSILHSWIKYQAYKERKSIISSLTPKARAKLISIFETEVNGLEGLLGFKIYEWNSESLCEYLQ